MAARRVIYTAITASRDNLHEPKHVLPDVDYVCFTDNPSLRSRVFEIRPLPFTEPDPSLAARRIKLHPHLLFPQHDISLWLDGSRRIIRDLSPWLALAEPHDFTMACLIHPQRDCLYDEGDYCIKHGRAPAASVIQQIDIYRELGMPPRFGLLETGVLLRRHGEEVNRLMDQWWRQVQGYSRRDQLALPFLLWQSKMEIVKLPYSHWHDHYYMQYWHAWHDPTDDRSRFVSKLRFYLHCIGRALRSSAS